MRYDATRPVPWKQLLFWSAGVAVLTNVSVGILSSQKFGSGVIIGSLVGAVVYFNIAVVMVKFGWRPPGLLTGTARHEAMQARQERVESRRKPTSRSKSAPTPVRAKPAATSRTRPGHNTPKRRH